MSSKRTDRADCVVVRIRFHGADVDFVKAMQFPLDTTLSGLLKKVDSVRVAAGWAEEKSIQSFGLLRMPAFVLNNGDAWIDDSPNITIRSLNLASREILEYRQLLRNIRIVRRDGTKSERVMVSERDPIGVALLGIVRSLSEDMIQEETVSALNPGIVVRLEQNSYFPHTALPLSANFTVLTKTKLDVTRCTNEEIQNNCSLFALLPWFQNVLLLKRSGGFAVNLRQKRWAKRFFKIHWDEFLCYKTSDDTHLPPLETLKTSDVHSITLADSNDCSDRKHHGCAILLDTELGERIIEARTQKDAKGLVRLLRRWLDLQPFFLLHRAGANAESAITRKFARAPSHPPPATTTITNTATQPHQNNTDTAETLAPVSPRDDVLPDDFTAHMYEQEVHESAAPRDDDRGQRELELFDEMTVSLTLSNTEPVHSLLPDVARQVKFENINELQSDDLDDESDIAVLDHESSLTEQQLPFDAILLLKKSCGRAPNASVTNQYATAALTTLLFVRLPEQTDRVFIRKGVSKEALHLELRGQYLYCYEDNQPADASIDDDNDGIGARDNDEQQEFGRLLGRVHVGLILFVSSDVHTSKSFKICVRRQPLSLGVLPRLPTRAGANSSGSKAQLDLVTYTFVCESSEIKLDWFDLLNDWLPFYQSLRPVHDAVDVSPADVGPRGLLGELLYSAEQLAAHRALVAAHTPHVLVQPRRRSSTDTAAPPARPDVEYTVFPRPANNDASTTTTTAATTNTTPVATTTTPTSAVDDESDSEQPPPPDSPYDIVDLNASGYTKAPQPETMPSKAAPAAVVRNHASEYESAAELTKSTQSAAAAAAAVAASPPGDDDRPRESTYDVVPYILPGTAELQAAAATASATAAATRAPVHPAPASAIHVGRRPSDGLSTSLPSNWSANNNNDRRASHFAAASRSPPIARRALSPPHSPPRHSPPRSPPRSPPPPRRARSPPPPVARRQPPPVAPRARAATTAGAPPPIATPFRRAVSPGPANRRAAPFVRNRSATHAHAAAGGTAAPGGAGSRSPAPPARPTRGAVVPPRAHTHRVRATSPRGVNGAAGTLRAAYHRGQPRFNVPPGDGTHTNPVRLRAFAEIVNSTVAPHAFFHGSLPRAEAEAKLHNKPSKTFLVRWSSVPWCLALSYVATDGSVVHVVLEYWDCAERFGWSCEDGKETYSDLCRLLTDLPLVSFRK